MAMDSQPTIATDNPAAAPRQRRIAIALLRAHRWIGLLLGIQLILWMASGVFMSWFSIDLVKGKTTSVLVSPTELVAHNYVAPGGIIAQSPGATDMQLSTFFGDPVYITSGNGQDNLFNALTGEKISPLREDNARRVAEQDYAGNAPIKHARLLSKAPHEYRGRLPVWQVVYKDDLETRLYISPYSGKVISRRNKVWRIYDFLWMLHIMDYDERDNINNPLLKAASATGLLFALTGFGLLILRLFGGFFWRDINSLRRRRQQRKDQ